MESPEAPLSHSLVPMHAVASEQEVQQVLEQLGCTIEQLPIIYSTDPAIANLGVRPGDVVKIQRTSQVTGQPTAYYRLVVESEA